MIKRIELQYFRSHEHTVFEFHDRVNVIVGRGQAGKTNIKRAIEWVKDNRPLGTRVISWFAGDEDLCFVAITVQNPNGEHCIAASRSRAGKLAYDITNDMGETQHFDTVGTKVPDLVTRLLNIDAINIHDQFSTPYLISGTTGEVSRAVNRVIDAEIADKWLSELDSRRNTTAIEIKAKKASVKAARARVEQLKPLDTVAELLMQVSMVETKIAARQRQAGRLGEIINTGMEALRQIRNAEYILNPVLSLLESAQTIQTTINQYAARATAINIALAAQGTAEALQKRYHGAKAQYIQTITDLGQCPTCYGPADERTINRIKEVL